MTYEETLHYLYTSIPVFQHSGASAYKPGLGTSIALDDYLGNPHKAYKTIHVAGTNGKGSVSHLLAAILRQSGFKVGLYTSPHLVDFRERIRVNGKKISQDYVVDFVERHRSFFEPLHPSFFELTSSMAFEYFRDQQVDYAVIEVGLGGRLDSTNIITPILSIITNISLDHTQFLGDTEEKIAAEKAGIPLSYDRACAIDLAVKGTSKTVLEAVRTSINPRVIDCPNPSSGQTRLTAVARDGIAVAVRARVTVRTNLDLFVGGATEETVVARVGEGIVSAVGSAPSYKDVLEKPEVISRTVSDKGVDAATAFEVLSIDIADVDVAGNVGARLQAEQAEADKQIAQAKAEVRRAAAVATEQEMAAKTQEMRAKVVAAEAEVPKAMAEALRSGKLGVMDYYQMQNVISDTRMREAIAGDDKTAEPAGEINKKK